MLEWFLLALAGFGLFLAPSLLNSDSNGQKREASSTNHHSQNDANYSSHHRFTTSTAETEAYEDLTTESIHTTYPPTSVSWPIDPPPYMVSIAQEGHLCLGSIISDHCVVTSASCLSADTNVNISVTDSTQNSTYPVDFIVTHDGYGKAGGKGSDLAILALSQNFDDTKMISLLNHQNLQAYSLMNSTWQTIEENSPAHSYIMQEVQILDNDSCRRALGSNEEIADGEVCTKLYRNEAPVDCKKLQPGSPLQRVDGQLAAIYTRHINCTFLVYTDIAYHKEWVEASINASRSKEFQVKNLLIKLYRN